MNPIGGVRWTEGMFLRPEHFQQSDLFHAGQRRYLAGVLNPFPWGVRRIEIDVEALENEILRVLRCEQVFPDGMVFQYPEAAQMVEQSFKDAFAATMESLGVYACVRTLADPGAGTHRYVMRAEQRRDLYDPANEAAIEYILPRAELIFTNDPEDERLAGFETVKIAEVRRTGRAAPRYELSRRYIPPVVRAEASTVLISAVRQVHDQLCAASQRLASHRRDRGAEGLAYGVGDLEQLLTLQMLNQAIPPLQHLLSHGGGHPFELFSLLAQLRGALCTYSPAEEPFTFPEYVHTDLAGCFFPILDSIRRLLEQLLPTHYEEIAFQREGSSFFADIDEGLLREGGPFLLALKGPGTAEALRKRIEGQAKISSLDDMRQLVRFADRGVPARFVEHPPAEIPRSADHSYFMIETGDPKWKKVRDAANLCFFLSDAEQDLNVRLFVVLPRGRRQS
jgi:type VI secretion system protein ImpJ